MSEHAGGLYDALHAFESRYRGHGYPVHKRLRLDSSSDADIYDWVADHLAVPVGGSILDAGCGVGFGTLRLARNGAVRVTGITPSGREVQSARAAAQSSPAAHGVQFVQCEFEDVRENAYDAVVAVESLKHSTDLERSLQRLLRSLKSGGTLAIVEDLFCGDECLPAARDLKRQWMLARLYGEPDYLAALGHPCTVIDLSDRVRKMSPLRAALRLGALKLCVPLGRSHRQALRAFVGGIQLDRLYARGAMRYKAIFCTRKEAA